MKMAFLCPSMRMRRDKKKATNATVVPIPVGRITGSASIETLVRVGIEKEHGLSPDSKMVVLHDFTPCVDDELEVKRGQLVNILYRENDWVYVIGQDSRRQEGFIPYSYCVPYNSPLADLSVKKKLPREQQAIDQNENVALLNAIEITDDAPALRNDIVGVGITLLKNSETTNLILQPECTPFRKDPSGRYIVLYTFIARDENDISVERGEFVTLLNREDPDWFWIVRSDGQEGFIPSSFVYPADSVLQTHQKMLSSYIPTENQQNTNIISNNNHIPTNKPQNINTNEHMTRTLSRSLNRIAHPPPLTTIDSSGNCMPQDQVQQHQQIALSAEELRFHGTELVVLYDYKAQAPDDLSVRGGEWIYADLNNQTVDGWLWAYAPKTRKYGFIPQTYARPQPQTQL